MSRLLTTLLLYRSGFYLGKYISPEAKTAQQKDLCYDALAASQIGWHEGTEDPVPFIKLVVDRELKREGKGKKPLILCLGQLLAENWRRRWLIWKRG